MDPSNCNIWIGLLLTSKPITNLLRYSCMCRRVQYRRYPTHCPLHCSLAQDRYSTLTDWWMTKTQSSVMTNTQSLSLLRKLLTVINIILFYINLYLSCFIFVVGVGARPCMHTCDWIKYNRAHIHTVHVVLVVLVVKLLYKIAGSSLHLTGPNNFIFQYFGPPYNLGRSAFCGSAVFFAYWENP